MFIVGKFIWTENTPVELYPGRKWEVVNIYLIYLGMIKML